MPIARLWVRLYRNPKNALTPDPCFNRFSSHPRTRPYSRRRTVSALRPAGRCLLRRGPLCTTKGCRQNHRHHTRHFPGNRHYELLLSKSRGDEKWLCATGDGPHSNSQPDRLSRACYEYSHCQAGNPAPEFRRNFHEIACHPGYGNCRFRSLGPPKSRPAAEIADATAKVPIPSIRTRS